MKDELSWKNLENYLYSAAPEYTEQEQPRCIINKPFDDLFSEELLPTAFYFDEDEENS